MSPSNLWLLALRWSAWCSFATHGMDYRHQPLGRGGNPRHYGERTTLSADPLNVLAREKRARQREQRAVSEGKPIYAYNEQGSLVLWHSEKVA
jgi:hypothetical protein